MAVPESRKADQNEQNLPYKIDCQYHKLMHVDDLMPHPDNENDHPEKQIIALGDIIEKDDWRHPIVVSKLSGYMAAGHGRLLSAKAKNWEYVPVQFQNFRDSVHELRVRNSDNNIAQYAEFNKQKLEENIIKLDLDPLELDMADFGMLDLELLDPLELKDSETNSVEDKDQFLIVVDCKDELEQNDLFNEFETREITCKLMN